jgi:nucleoside-diphosphate-sugar epimerase
MKILVTGARGFIGREVVRQLLQRGDHVRAMYRNTLPETLPLSEKFEVVRGDMGDVLSLDRAASSCDAIVHLAAHARNWARDPGVFEEVNVLGTERLLNIALKRGIRSVVVTSSALTLGPSNGRVQDESWPRKTPPFTDYERTKLASEKIVMRFVRKGLQAVIVNPTRVFGPGPLTEGNSLTKMIKWYLEGKWHLVLGSGESVGNYSFVSDVARGHLLALERGRAGQRYILGGQNLTFNEFFRIVDSVTGRPHLLIRLPSPAAYTFSRAEVLRAKLFRSYPLITPGWVRTLMSNASYTSAKAEAELGYSVTPFVTALERTLWWIRRSESGKEAEA